MDVYVFVFRFAVGFDLLPVHLEGHIKAIYCCLVMTQCKIRLAKHKHTFKNEALKTAQHNHNTLGN